MLFSPGEIEEVKRSVDLVALVRSSGVELTKKGRNYVGRCPFHMDKSASLVVTPDKGLWNCLGACRNNGHPSGGDAIGFGLFGFERTAAGSGRAWRVLG